MPIPGYCMHSRRCVLRPLEERRTASVLWRQLRVLQRRVFGPSNATRQAARTTIKNAYAAHYHGIDHPHDEATTVWACRCTVRDVERHHEHVLQGVHLYWFPVQPHHAQTIQDQGNHDHVAANRAEHAHARRRRAMQHARTVLRQMERPGPQLLPRPQLLQQRVHHWHRPYYHAPPPHHGCHGNHHRWRGRHRRTDVQPVNRKF